MVAFILNFVFFQACWLTIVIGAAHGLRWPGFALTALFLAWELYRSEKPLALLYLVGLGIAGGIIVDGGYALSGVVDYQIPAGPLAPWWILGMWVAFALTLTGSMGWMRSRPLIGSAMAGVAAPLAYIAGSHFGAIEFPRGQLMAIVVTAATWIPTIYLMVRATNYWFADKATTATVAAQP
ncbi:MAG: DUF2878 domain-containing protein [Pseudomonadota bacterium]